MRAWFYTRYGGPAVLQTGEQSDATLQSTHDVVIKVHAASLNPIDYKRRQGALKVILDEHWPHIVGYDVSGVVVECGAEVMRFQVGDEVFGMLPHNRNGALAEYVPMRYGRTDNLPDSGAETCIFKSFERELAEYDFAFDCTGESVKCFECVTKNGSVISISETPSADELRGLESKGVQFSRFIGFVLNCLSHSVAKKARQAQINYSYFFVVDNGAALDEIRTLCEQNAISPVIDKVYPFEKADTAMEYLEAGHAIGKVVVEVIPGAV
ncbi:alcohol dehydrogenase, partial [Globisporangium splendens]